MRKLTVLRESALYLEGPCHESFLDMPVRGAGRHCGSCERTVVDMTRMSREEAETLYAKSGGDLCGYVLRDAEGTAFFPEVQRPTLGLAAVGLAATLLAPGCGAADVRADEPPSLLVDDAPPMLAYTQGLPGRDPGNQNLAQGGIASAGDLPRFLTKTPPKQPTPQPTPQSASDAGVPPQPPIPMPGRIALRPH